MRLQEFSEPLTFINFLRGIITTRFVSAKVHRFHKVVRKPYVTPTIFCASFIDNREFNSHFYDAKLRKYIRGNMLSFGLSTFFL